VSCRAPRDHYPAPYAIIELWARHGARGAAAYEAEARSIAHLFTTATSRNLVRVFLLQDRLKGAGGKSPLEMRHVHVVGAGVMGGDIAAWSALRGFTVTLQDRASEFIEPAMKRAAELFDKRLRDPARNAAARARLRADVAGDGVPQADVVIEAIFENLEAKRELYARLEPRMKPAALLATNTSSIMLEPLAARLARPERLVGLHFFNPVAQMPLIEIVHAARTDPAAVQAATAFARRLDKLPVACRSAPGFMVNRVLTPYMYEAMLAAQEGVPHAVIDRCAVDFGMPVGPLELIDVVGLDVAAHVGEIIAQQLARPVTQITRLNELLAAKKYGRKSGEGFYLWRDGKAVRPAADAAAPEDLIDRLILVLVNECVACLREHVVEDADLVDAAVVFGTGFAPFRGGPLTYARARGVTAVAARLAELAARHGERFRPDPGWSAFGDTQKA
jgi:3-hydroxyacyl-CoA dehydrogenase / enoyl-CoA hydratase / 3-hydroxybutyryl-CoA epimerase